MNKYFLSVIVASLGFISCVQEGPSLLGSSSLDDGPGVPGNLSPVVTLSNGTGLGSSYQASQLGGLSFVRFGNEPPGDTNNDVAHSELLAFIDDPFGNAAGGFSAHCYFYNCPSGGRFSVQIGGNATSFDHKALGWSISANNDKYADGNGKITPVPGAHLSGDVYRGYFVPANDGIYTFANRTQPDNSVRFLMSNSECSNKARPIISADIFGEQGAVDQDSVAIQAGGGNLTNRFAATGAWHFNTNDTYLHNTASFFPGGSGHAQYQNGDVYLTAGNIYYLEIRYGEGGGGQAFEFGVDRKNFDGTGSTGVQDLLASQMLPYSGTDRYQTRQICSGQSYDASELFNDPEGDTLTFSARLVNADGSRISGSASLPSYVGLSVNATTGVISGTANGLLTTQKIVFRAKDPAGSNRWSETSPLVIIK